MVLLLVHLNHWFPTSGPRSARGPHKPKYGPRTILILWLGIVVGHSDPKNDIKVVLDQEKVENPWSKHLINAK